MSNKQERPEGLSYWQVDDSPAYAALQALIAAHHGWECRIVEKSLVLMGPKEYLARSFDFEEDRHAAYKALAWLQEQIGG